MSYTTAEYLQSLIAQHKKLAENLNTKGVETDDSETFNSLAEKITTIYDTGGLAYGEWTPPVNTDEFEITGLNALPTHFGLSCEKVITDKITETGSIFIAVLNFEPDSEGVTLYKYLDDSTFIYDKVTTDLVYSVTQADNGTYTVKISFAAFNEMTQKPYYFKGGFEYNWVASSKAWFL